MFIPDARTEFFHPGTWDTDLDFFVGDIVKFTRFEQPAMIEGKRYRTVAVYDLIMGAEQFDDYETMQQGLDWFRQYFPKQYMTILD